MLEVSWSQGGDLCFAGRFDAAQVGIAKAALGKIEQSGTIDLARLDYISSAGLGALLETYKRLNDQGGTLTLKNVSLHVRNVLHFAGLDRLFMFE
jgi:anti-anti-sigma factor